jgi:hypothetical protein
LEESTAEEKQRIAGWVRGVIPSRATAQVSVQRFLSANSNELLTIF